MQFVLLLLLISIAEAGLWSRCQNFFQNFRSTEAQFLSEIEEQEWQALFGPQGNFPYMPEVRLEEQFFYHVWQKLPPKVQQKILSPPNDQEDYLRYLLMLEHESTNGKNSFLSQIRKYLTEKPEAQAWLKELKEKHEAASAEQKAQWEAIFKKSTTLAKARSSWDNSFVLSPAIEQGKFWTLLGKQYPYRIAGRRMYVRVPREKVAHPAWNPLSAETLKAQAIHGVGPPKRYETVLGHDGKFYLLDGNHRFHLDQRSRVEVELSWPPQTGSMRVFFDLVNIPQPSDEQLLRLYQKQITWQELVRELKGNPEEFLLMPQVK